MPHVIHSPIPPITSKSGNFRVHQIPAAADNFVWLLEYETGKCAAIDGPSANETLLYCAQHNLELTTILNTHTHGDHIGINKDLARKDMMRNIAVFGAQKKIGSIPFLTHPLNDGDSIQLGNIKGIAWLTEGHINGHMSYIFDEFLFCGDTLFTGGCGYLFDGPPEKMHNSLQRLATLPSDTLVCCAHEYTLDNLRFALSVEPKNIALQDRYRDVAQKTKEGKPSVPSRLELEQQTNPFLRVSSAAEFTKRRQEKNSGQYRHLEPQII